MGTHRASARSSLPRGPPLQQPRAWAGGPEAPAPEERPAPLLVFSKWMSPDLWRMPTCSSLPVPTEVQGSAMLSSALWPGA